MSNVSNIFLFHNILEYLIVLRGISDNFVDYSWYPGITATGLQDGTLSKPYLESTDYYVFQKFVSDIAELQAPKVLPDANTTDFHYWESKFLESGVRDRLSSFITAETTEFNFALLIAATREKEDSVSGVGALTVLHAKFTQGHSDTWEGVCEVGSILSVGDKSLPLFVVSNILWGVWIVINAVRLVKKQVSLVSFIGHTMCSLGNMV